MHSKPLHTLLLALGWLVVANVAQAQVITYTWIATGDGTNADFNNTANWQGGVVPVNTGQARLNFPTGTDTVTLPSGALNLDSLYFNTAYPGASYTFSSAGSTTLTIAPTGSPYGQDSTTPTNGSYRSLVFGPGIDVNFAVNQTWTASSLTFNGATGGAGTLSYAPHGYYANPAWNTGNLTLNGPGNFTGGLETNNVYIHANHAAALAGGPLTFIDTSIQSSIVGHTLNNTITLAGSFSGYTSVLEQTGTLTLTGPVTFAGNVGMSGDLRINGSIGETGGSRMLHTTSGSIRLAGTNTYTGGTTIGSSYFSNPDFIYIPATVVFENAGSVPASGTISANFQSYAGIAFTSGVQAGFISQLDTEGFAGTIGFDSLGATQMFSENINLGYLNNHLGLGSSTSAILTGTITTSGEGFDNYRFGNGGGTLAVASSLTGSKGVEATITGYQTPTTIVLQGNNTFTGNVELASGLVIFDSANALPGGAVINLNQETGSWDFAYAGFTENSGLTPAVLLSQFNPLANQVVLGVDSTNPNAPSTLSDAINLTGVLADFTGETFFIGTATGSTLTGTLTTGEKELGLTGLKGAQLTVNSTLTDATIGGLVLGLHGVNNLDVTGIVRLNGNNTFTSGTTWVSGDLALGHASALGTGSLAIDHNYEGARLTYTGDFTVTNTIRFDSYNDVLLGKSDSVANLTLTGSITGANLDGFDYQGAGTLTYAGSNPALGSLTINAAPGGGVVYARPDAVSKSTSLVTGNLTVSANTDIMWLESETGSNVHLGAGATLSLLDNSYGEGPVVHRIGGTLAGPGALQVVGNGLALLNANTYAGGTTLDGGDIGFTQSTALGSGVLTVLGEDNGLYALAPDLTLANAIQLQGELRLGSSTYFGYQAYDTPGNRNYTLSGIISGPGSLYKDSNNTITLTGANTFSGGVQVAEGTVIFSHNQAAGTGLLDLGGYGSGTAIFTTAAPVIGGLRADESTGSLQLAANSTLTIHQAKDATYQGSISGSGARINKDGPGYLTLAGGGAYTYTGGTGITAGGVIFNSGTAITTNAPGGITVGAGAYAGLGSSAETAWDVFAAKIDSASTGTLGVDHNGSVSGPIGLTGFAPGLRLGSATFGTLAPTAEITPNGDYLFGGGGGTLEVKSTLTDALKSVDVNSPAGQPLTLWLRNSNYFGGPLTATNSAVVFDAHALDYVSGLQLGGGGYLGSADLQLAPAAFLAKLAPGTNTGAVGFDSFHYSGRVVGGTIDLSTFGPGLYLGTATGATLRGPIILPGGSSAYRFAAYKGTTLTVDTNLGGSQGVVIGDLDSYGTMRNPHNESQRSVVQLTGLNTYTGGTVLNAGTLVAGPQSLGTGALTVQPNAFPATEEPVDNLPRFEPLEYGATFTHNLILNGSLALGGTTLTTLSGTLSGPGALYVNRYDYLPVSLTGANTYTGGTVLLAGNIALGHNTALGTGAVTVHNGGGLLTEGGARTLANTISVVQDDDDNDARLRVGGDYSLTLNGPVAFDPGRGYVQNASSSFSHLPLLRFNGGLSGDTQLTFDTGGMVWLAGTNTYTGGTEVNSGAVIFDSVASMPAQGQFHTYASYLGLASPTAALQTAYIDRFSEGYGRLIGFDSPNAASPNTFSADIDLTALDHPYLSSATAAILTGAIMPFGDNYRFGGAGGGVLTVASGLTGNRNVTLDYAVAPLLVRLAGTNTYSGTTTVNGTGLIYATAASLPAGQHFQPNASTGSYFGYEDPAISVGSFLSHFQTAAQHTIVGFDSVDVNSPRTITSPDLSYFTNNPAEIYIGTASRVIMDGTITWPGFNTGHNFAAYRTGWLTVNSILGGSAITRIGSDRQDWTVRDFDGVLPTVELAGANTYTGGTYFFGGQLAVSHANALGAGQLDVRNPNNYAEGEHRLLLNTPGIANNIFLENYNIELRLATTLASATLSGQIGGNGSLVKAGANTVILSGGNSFTGDIFVEQGVLGFTNGAAIGSAQNRLVFRDAGGTAHFSAGNPVIGWLESAIGSSATVQIDGGVNLGIGAHNAGYTYQVSDYFGSLTGAGSLTKDGLGTLALHGASTYTGGTTIKQGQLLADHANALGTGAITLDGGELVFGRGITIPNAISFGGSGGLLSGASTFTGPVVLGAQAGLSPGESPGTMTFASDLTLAGASFLDFEIQDPTGLAGAGYDTLVVGGTLFVTANPATPFVINVSSLDAGNGIGQLQISDPNASYSLVVVSAGVISGFAPENFTLNTASFSTNWGDDFSFSLVQSGNQLLLNFSPVPEPSTYALLGLGGLLAGLARWRARFTKRD